MLLSLFWCSNYLRFGQWEPLQGGSYILLTCPRHFEDTFLLSGIIRYPRPILSFSLSWVYNQPFHSIYWKIIFKAPRSWNIHWCWDVNVARLPQWTEIGNFIYTISSSKFTIKQIRNKHRGPSFTWSPPKAMCSYGHILLQNSKIIKTLSLHFDFSIIPAFL